MIDFDIPKKSQRMLSRSNSESPNSDAEGPIVFNPNNEKPCFALSKLVAKTAEERRQKFYSQKHINQPHHKEKSFLKNIDFKIKDKEPIKGQAITIVSQLEENLKKLRFDQSLIHQWGVYTTEHIRKGEAIIEYIGELIRLRVVEKRQIKYEAEGNNGSYIFQLEKDKLIDATHKGGLARFINHSCGPNCTTDIVEFIDGSKHIVIFAKRDIFPYEELCYDYKLEYETKDKRIKCLCGSPNCKHWLNWDENAEKELNYKYINGRELKRSFNRREGESNSSSEANESNEENASQSLDKIDSSNATETGSQEPNIQNDFIEEQIDQGIQPNALDHLDLDLHPSSPADL